MEKIWGNIAVCLNFGRNRLEKFRQNKKQGQRRSMGNKL